MMGKGFIDHGGKGGCGLEEKIVECGPFLGRGDWWVWGVVLWLGSC